MGDSNDNRKGKDQESDSGSSLKPLRSVKPSENITISVAPPSNSVEEVQKVHELVPEEGAVPAVISEAKVETFFEKPLEPSLSENKKLTGIEIKSEIQTDAEVKSDLSTVINPKATEEPPKDKLQASILEKKARVGSAASGLIQSERIIRNQSDIFSLKEQTSIASAIFSVNGSPSRKVFRRKEVVASNVFPFGQMSKEEPPSEKAPMVTAVKEKTARDSKECYNELTRPSGSARNPLTGTGLSSNDEYKFKGSKRKDGNPLLGLGYSPEVTPSAHRIPPGGYSHKLW